MTRIDGCLRASDGRLRFQDTSCERELLACIDAAGQAWVYHADCDGVGESDGWFQVCTDATDGRFYVLVPDDCCNACEFCTRPLQEGHADSFESVRVEYNAGTNTWTRYSVKRFYIEGFEYPRFEATRSTKVGGTCQGEYTVIDSVVRPESNPEEEEE